MNEIYLREAIALSIEKMQAGEGGPFGAIIVQDDKVIGCGWNRVTSINDPTAHAEIEAIRDACRTLGTFKLAGCEIYCSCEPCPMCYSAIYWARLNRIYHAATAQDAAAIQFDDDNLCIDLCKPKPERIIPMAQALRKDACKAFQLWKAKSDRIEY